MEVSLIELLGHGGAVGGGAIVGAIIIINFLRKAVDELKIDIKEITGKLDTVIQGHEISKATTQVQIDNIREQIIELDRRLLKLEEGNYGHPRTQTVR
jgi:hypothetical protein